MSFSQTFARAPADSSLSLALLSDSPLQPGIFPEIPRERSTAAQCEVEVGHVPSVPMTLRDWRRLQKEAKMRI